MMQRLIAKINKENKIMLKAVDELKLDNMSYHAKKLPTNVLSTVLKTNLLPRFILPFTVVAKRPRLYAKHSAQNTHTPSV